MASSSLPNAVTPVPHGRALWTLYESACHQSLGAFEAAAIAQLDRLVGADGAVWGRGSIARRGVQVQIDSANVFGRPLAIVADYAGVGSEDPLPQRFFDRPGMVQAVTVNDFYRSADRRRMGEYLGEYRVRQLMLGGGPDRAVPPPACVMSWITLYRSDSERPFTVADAALYFELLPHWVQAHAICTAMVATRACAPATSGTLRSRVAPAVQAPSPREAEVLALISRGFTADEMAALTGLSAHTVRSHVRSLYAKLDVHSRTEAVFEARQLGWLA